MAEALGAVTPTGPTTTAGTPSTTTPATTAPTPVGAGCSATYPVTNSWEAGFVGAVEVTAGSSPVTSWTVSRNWPGAQSITDAWNATATTSGTTVTAKNASDNGALAAGGSTTWGFQANGDTTGVPTVTCSASRLSARFKAGVRGIPKGPGCRLSGNELLIDDFRSLKAFSNRPKWSEHFPCTGSTFSVQGAVFHGV